MSTMLTLGVAGFFLVMGLVGLARPESILAYFGVTSLPLDARNEVRAVYGGFGVAIALLLTTTLWIATLRTGVLVCVSVSLLGMAGGRSVSLTIERPTGVYPLVFLAVELLLAAMSIAALLTT